MIKESEIIAGCSRDKFDAYFGKNTWCIYAYIAELPQGGSLAIKIGITSNPHSRAGQLKTGMPFKAVMIWEFCRNRSCCTKTERMLHRRLQSRRISGEWFSFENTDPDKREFREVIAEVFNSMNGRLPHWKFISPDKVNTPKDSKAPPTARASKCIYCDAPVMSYGTPFCDEDCRQKHRIA